MKKQILQILLILFVGMTLLLINHYQLNEYLTFAFLKENIGLLKYQLSQSPFQVVASFMIIYIATTALSIPGATILSLAAGALFGFSKGLILVSFASTIGASLAFLGARFLFKDFVQTKFKDRIKVINEGIENEGAFYLLSLRLAPIVPFFVINLAMGLTPIKLRTFFFVSQLGMLLGTAIYINAGVQLGKVNSVADILSPTLLVSLFGLGLLPIMGKKLVSFSKDKNFF